MTDALLVAIIFTIAAFSFGVGWILGYAYRWHKYG